MRLDGVETSADVDRLASCQGDFGLIVGAGFRLVLNTPAEVALVTNRLHQQHVATAVPDLADDNAFAARYGAAYLAGEVLPR